MKKYNLDTMDIELNNIEKKYLKVIKKELNNYMKTLKNSFDLKIEEISIFEFIGEFNIEFKIKNDERFFEQNIVELPLTSFLEDEIQIQINKNIENYDDEWCSFKTPNSKNLKATLGLINNYNLIFPKKLDDLKVNFQKETKLEEIMELN